MYERGSRNPPHEHRCNQVLRSSVRRRKVKAARCREYGRDVDNVVAGIDDGVHKTVEGRLCQCLERMPRSGSRHKCAMCKIHRHPVGFDNCRAHIDVRHKTERLDRYVVISGFDILGTRKDLYMMVNLSHSKPEDVSYGVVCNTCISPYSHPLHPKYTSPHYRLPGIEGLCTF
jgi:hypothetical protein